VLIVPHPAGHAMHDQPQPPLSHRTFLPSHFVTAWLLGYTRLGWTVKGRLGRLNERTIFVQFDRRFFDITALVHRAGGASLIAVHYVLADAGGD